MEVIKIELEATLHRHQYQIELSLLKLKVLVCKHYYFKFMKCIANQQASKNIETHSQTYMYMQCLKIINVHL